MKALFEGPEFKTFLPHVQEILQTSLLNLVDDFFKNPGKNVRPRLVEIGFRLAFSTESEADLEAHTEKLQIACQIVEASHAGALIVDDIEDGSEMRRNLPTLHLTHGSPKALNAGNWLYFWGLEQIQRLNLNPIQQVRLNDICLSYISRAHMGQAIDIGTEISKLRPSEIKSVSFASMKLKTGTLLSLALNLGAAVASRNYDEKVLDELGAKLGIILQTFDDIGNFFQPNIKRFEDLKLRRPTWAWAIAASYEEAIYQEFLSALENLPNEEALSAWCERHKFKDKIFSETKLELEDYFNFCQTNWTQTHPVTAQALIDLGKYLEKAYV